MTFCTSCVTILGGKQTLQLSSSPSGAKAYVGTKYVGTTPCSYTSKELAGSITFELSGYNTKTIYTKTKFNAHSLWNFLFTGVIGFIVDIASGECDKYSQTSYYAKLEKCSVNTQTASTPVSTSEINKPKQEIPKPKMSISKTISRSSIPKSSNNTLLSSERIFSKCNPAVFKIDNNIQQGSGFFISNKGIGISNYHVFDGSRLEDMCITLSNGSKYKIEKILAADKDKDYIVFKVSDIRNCAYIPVSSRKWQVGQNVYAIGSPYSLDNTFSSGNISGNRGNGIIQISVPIDHGSSGGVLLNKYGEAIGITTAGFDRSSANLNFAIDINVIFKKQ